MTPDRKTILEYVWRELYSRTCPCGRCGCISSDPVDLARRVLFGFGQGYLRLAAIELGRADVYARQTKKTGKVIADELGFTAKQANYARRARMYDRAARRMFRLWRGRPPFKPHPETERDGGAS